MPAAVELEKVYFSYPDNPILSDVSLTITEGECIGVIGPNGGGKSTLLKLIASLLTPQEGKLLLFGNKSEYALSSIAYVPQSLGFDRQFPISVLEVVLTGRLSRLKWWGGYSHEDKEIALGALKKVGLQGFQGRNFSSLSGGELQRVLIARALASEPRLLLLDEPTASVDQEAEASIFSLLSELKKELTLIMVTHDLNRAVHFFDRLLVVQHNVIPMTLQEVCEHFAVGLYHTPMIDAGHSLIQMRPKS